MATPDEIGDRVRRLRESKGMTQAELGTRIGLSQTSVAQIETGVTLAPRRTTLRKLCDFFDVTEDYLLRGTREPFLEGGAPGQHGSTVFQAGELKARYGDKFPEDVDGALQAGQPTDGKGFIRMLLAEIEVHKAEKAQLKQEKEQLQVEKGQLIGIIHEQRESLKEQRENATFLRQQLAELGKTNGNQQEAPGYAYAVAEPAAPIGFGRVRSMYPAGLPDRLMGASRKAAA